MLIAIEGIDGSGKGTQAARVTEQLRKQGKTVQLLSFPRYDATFFGRAIGEFLNGKFGSLDEVPPFLASLLYAGDRFESRDVLNDALASNDIVVLDRYVASNIAHQGAKVEGEERQRLIRDIEHLEYEIYGLPRCDCTILLDLPVGVAQQLIAKKAQRTYTEKAADLQEADGSYLAKVRSVYRELTHNDPAWSVVDCVCEDKLRSLEEITQEILDRL
ncbi:thymidylate kinase [Thalassoroseus pseudoceratinae]|uniref:thymidylate kinase n=1 Tax=Thalassoroseus pseudoceratinae TaxID=2713176 RepID=UPI001F0D6CEA|nr:thymidylate kinase [Thalassoroseus pseudoceratinae]